MGWSGGVLALAPAIIAEGDTRLVLVLGGTGQACVSATVRSRFEIVLFCRPIWWGGKWHPRVR